jgi:hypothetical protein
VTRYLKKIKTSSGGTGNGQPLSSTEWRSGQTEVTQTPGAGTCKGLVRVILRNAEEARACHTEAGDRDRCELCHCIGCFPGAAQPVGLLKEDPSPSQLQACVQNSAPPALWLPAYGWGVAWVGAHYSLGRYLSFQPILVPTSQWNSHPRLTPVSHPNCSVCSHSPKAVAYSPREPWALRGKQMPPPVLRLAAPEPKCSRNRPRRSNLFWKMAGPPWDPELLLGVCFVWMTCAM